MPSRGLGICQESSVSRQIVKLERAWGTTDDECRAFLLDLYRELYGRDRTKSHTAVELSVDHECQEVIIDEYSQPEAWVTLLLAAARADPTWRRLYRVSE
jgi:hypothetical protein